MAAKKPFSKLLVIRGLAFEADLASYAASKDTASLRKVFRDKNYTAKQIGVEYRVINHWDEQGLLPEASRNEAGQWRKFSFIEAVWIRVVIRLRGYGISLAVIAEIKKCIMEWDKKHSAYLLFEYYFLKAIENDADHFVLYSAAGTGKTGLVSARELELLKILSVPQDMLLISLKSVASSLGLPTTPVSPAVMLSEGEEEVVYQARTPHTKEISAQIRDGRVAEVGHLKTYSGDLLLQAITKAMRDEKGYGEITRNFEEGIPQSISVRKKKRFK